uniref:Reverse transcriptase domain-containing protein n=1 Tax=Tanacetum cinerariifolium TaxID=118510 RepID=A0A6L2LQC5_TANCI|nr:reverse transcriptase domain-containing protein [Tanacetum cinerariifolium]
MPPRRNRNINDVYEQEFKWHIMARIEEPHQFVDQLADQMNDGSSLFAKREEWEDDGVVDDNYEEAPVFDDDQYEDVIEEEEEFVGK